MDTVLTGIPTSTRQLKVYNPNKKALLISSIVLADAGKSGFRINVDGIKGNQFSDIEIAGEDSNRQETTEMTERMKTWIKDLPGVWQ